MKVHRMRAELFLVDGRTGTHNGANSRLSQFCSTPKKKRSVVKYAEGTKNVTE
jgi:hypothetical protein